MLGIMPTRAELVWDGKYDAKGNRVAPLRAELPFQTVETINESRKSASRTSSSTSSKSSPGATG